MQFIVLILRIFSKAYNTLLETKIRYSFDKLSFFHLKLVGNVHFFLILLKNEFRIEKPIRIGLSM